MVLFSPPWSLYFSVEHYEVAPIFKNFHFEKFWQFFLQNSLRPHIFWDSKYFVTKNIFRTKVFCQTQNFSGLKTFQCWNSLLRMNCCQFKGSLFISSLVAAESLTNQKYLNNHDFVIIRALVLGWQPPIASTCFT